MRSGLPAVSFVVPTFNEAGRLPALLKDLEAFLLPFEVVVADGCSGDGTTARAAALGARVVTTPSGRGRQLREGAGAARAPVLCFLHADVRLDAAALSELGAAAGRGGAWALRLHIAAPGWRYRFVEWGANTRAAMGMPYGDQGLLLSRALYDAVGGYHELPIMEDVALVRALRQRGVRVRLLHAAASVSPRRWQQDGVLRRMLRNWVLLAAYLAGVPAERLARRYPPPSAA